MPTQTRVPGAASSEVDFELERFERTSADRIEIAGRWYGLRGRRLLLPRSDAPAVRELRDELTTGLRHAVLASRDAELAHRFSEHPLGADDLEVHEHLLELLAADDPRRAAVIARAARLMD